MNEFLEWVSDGFVWIEDQVYEICQNTSDTINSLNQLITDLDIFINMATIYLYASGAALFILFIMLIVTNSKLKRLKIIEAQLSDIHDMLYQKEDNNGEYDSSYIQGYSSGS